MEYKNMNWKLIISLSLFGVVMGGLSLFGYTQHGIEPVLWILTGLFFSYLIAKYAPKRVFMHGLWVGILEGIIKSIITFAGWNTYIQHNNMEAFSQPAPLSANLFTLIIGIVIGSVYGVILGLISILFRKIFIKKPLE
jgi:thiamine transporter ThiT